MRLYSAALMIAVLILPAALGPAHSAHGQSPNGSIAASHRVMTDMTGRKVVLPTQIHRIVTIGPVPVLNSLVFALGAGDEIANGLPVQYSGPHYRFETRFQPSLLSKPRVQGNTSNPDLEAILKVMPDVAITLDSATGELLEKNGIPAVVLVYRVPDDLKRLMRFLGEVLNRRAAAEEYVQYLDRTIERVGSVVANIPKEQRPRVLYFSVKTLTQPQLIGEWWIAAAGGISVTNNGRQTEAYSFSLEQVLTWNPDVLFVTSPDDVKQLHQDPRLSTLTAVKAGRVYIVPTGAHLWANRTSEQPLTLLWAAQKLHPVQFKSIDMVAEMQSFYSRFYHYSMSGQEAQELLRAEY